MNVLQKLNKYVEIPTSIHRIVNDKLILNSNLDYVPLISVLQNFKYDTYKYKRKPSVKDTQKVKELREKEILNYIEWLSITNNSSRNNVKSLIKETIKNFDLNISKYNNWGVSNIHAILENIETIGYYKTRKYNVGSWFLMDHINKKVLLSLMVNKKDIPEIIECFVYNKEYPLDKFQLWVRLDLLKQGKFNKLILEKAKNLNCEIKFVANFKCLFNIPSFDMTIREQKEYFNKVTTAFLKTIPDRSPIVIDYLSGYMLHNPRNAEELMAIPT